MSYDLADVVRVEADGPVRIVRLNRPEQLNAINEELHSALTALANHVCPDEEVLDAAGAAAHKRARPPRQAVESTKRVLNLHVERAVLATIDFAMAAESESFDTDDLRANVDRFLGRAPA